MLLFKKKHDTTLIDLKQKHTAKLQMYGHGENSLMGSFLLEGTCEIIHFSDYVEKAGLKIEKLDQAPIFMKLKIGKFSL